MLKRTTGEKVFAVFNYTGMVLLSLIFLIPVWHVLMGSLSDPSRSVLIPVSSSIRWVKLLWAVTDWLCRITPSSARMAIRC